MLYYTRTNTQIIYYLGSRICANSHHMLVTVFVIFAFVLINIGKVKDVSSSPSSAAFETLTDKKKRKFTSYI